MNKLLIYTLLLPFWFSALQVSSSLSDKTLVSAVLFYSPNCGHCYHVITEVLPPLFEQYGDQLYIIGVDVTLSNGQDLFLATLLYFNLKSGGVPFLLVGDTYLLGSVDIPEKFPGLIEHHLAQGGVDWPDFPSLAEALNIAETQTTSTPEPNRTPISTQSNAIAPATLVSTSVTAGVNSVDEPTPAPSQSGLILADNPTASLRVAR